MISWLLLLLRALTGMARSRSSLAAENAVLRHQLSVLQRERPRLAEGDPSYDRGLLDQGRCPSRARWPSPRLPTLRVAQAHPQIQRLAPKRALSFLVTPLVAGSDPGGSEGFSLRGQSIPERSGLGAYVPPKATQNAPRICADGVFAEHGALRWRWTNGRPNGST
jgi:hypothetical protein